MLDKIGRPVTVRVYGKTVNTWTHIADDGREYATQYEVAYREYDSETLELVGVGTEDFSPTRWRYSVAWKDVFTWDGERRNKGGHRWFDYRGGIKFRCSDRKAVLDYLSKRYDAELVQLR